MSEVIFGKNKSKGIVAAEIIDNYVVCLTNENEEIHLPMVYWVLTTIPTKKGRKLKGNQHYKYITTMDTAEEYQEFLNKCRKKRVDFYTVYHDIESSMLYHGYTFYKDIKISDISVLAFDIEASGLTKDETSEVFVITNTFRNREGEIIKKQFVLDDEKGQGHLIDQWCAWVREVDPDIITGHNINGYDLPYLNHCSDNGLALGRDDSTITFRKKSSDYRVDGSQTWQYNKIKCYGRDIIDGMFLAVKYDIGRNYPAWGLKPIAEYEGWVTEDRQFYDASQIGKNWHIPEEREKIIAYCADDSDDSLRVFDLMAPSFFYMCQAIPKPFQVVTESASGSWLNALLVRSYLQDNYSIPKASEKEYVGGGMSWGNPGLYTNVTKWDAKSFYPSTIIAFDLYDEKKDPKGHYLEMVKYFTNKRFEQKAKYKETGEKHFDDLQASSKVFINSAYGLMGTQGLNFNNFKIAQEITKCCRKGLQKCILWATGKDVDYWWGIKEPLYKHVTFPKGDLLKYKIKYEDFLTITEENSDSYSAYVPSKKSGKEWKVCYKHSKASKQDYPDFDHIDTRAKLTATEMPKHDWVLVNIDTDALSFAKKDGSAWTEDEYDMIFKEINEIMYSEWEDDGMFDKFLVVKAKNYVMQEKGADKYKFKGSSITDSKKEPALTEQLKTMIDDIMTNGSKGINNIYNNYIKEVCNIDNIDRWSVKKNVTASVLNPERSNEQKVLDAIGDKIVQEGDKIFVFSDVDGERQKIKNGEPVFLKSGKPSMEPNRILRMSENFTGSYDLLHYLDRVYKTTEILETVLDMNKIQKYTKSKLHLLEELK